ncbi:MAG: AAA family ATPase, partial [Candidatus Nitrosotenuis sp.]
LQNKFNSYSAKEIILKQIEERKSELIRYVKEAILSIQKSITEKERKIRDCQGCFDIAAIKDELDLKLLTIKSELENIRKKSSELETKKAILIEHEELAKRLQLQDGKCPVCDSLVNELKPIFQVEHIRVEQENIRTILLSLESKKRQLLLDEKEVLEQSNKSAIARATLNAHSIQNPEQLTSLTKEVETEKTKIENVPLVMTNSGLLQASEIDSHAKTLYLNIDRMQKEIVGFDQNEFLKLKINLESTKKEISRIDQEYGGITQKILHSHNRLNEIKSILHELVYVKDYITRLDEIQNNIYNRDGPVATSLRTWALSTISSKASEYLEMLNTKIHRISLTEKTRDISITCYSKNNIVDIESLSGGEQVSVALSLRLGMAHLLGSSNLNFIILDEPTTHLDSSRRRSLVGVLSQLTDISKTNPTQFIIITHDAEIFEDSAVEKIYRFESGEDGTRVNLL